MAFQESRNRIMAMAAELEATYGADPTINGAQDGFNTTNSDTPWNSDIQVQEFRNHGPGFTRGKDVIGIRLGRITCNVQLQGSGTAGTAVQGVNDMLQACGLTETIVAITSTTYSPSTVALLKSAWIVADLNGFLGVMSGSYGNAVFSAQAGEPVNINLQMQGLYTAPTLGTIASWAVGATGADRALPFINCTAIINNGTDTWTGATVLGFSLDLQNEIKQIPDANSTNGLKKLLFADRNPKCMLDLVLDTDTAGAIVQANEFYINCLASTTHDLQWKVSGAAGNINTFNIDTAQVRALTISPGDGFRRLGVDYKAQHATAEAELSLVQT